LNYAGKQSGPLFRLLFRKLLAELIIEPIIDRNPGDDSNPQLEIILLFFSSGFTGVAAWWLEKGKPLSVEKASLQIAHDILPDYLRLMGT
jgi:hypothetical protein